MKFDDLDIARNAGELIKFFLSVSLIDYPNPFQFSWFQDFLKNARESCILTLTLPLPELHLPVLKILLRVWEIRAEIFIQYFIQLPKVTQPDMSTLAKKLQEEENKFEVLKKFFQKVVGIKVGDSRFHSVLTLPDSLFLKNISLNS